MTDLFYTLYFYIPSAYTCVCVSPRLLEEERKKLIELMDSQRHLETPGNYAVTTQEKTPEPQKEEDNLLSPESPVIPPSSSPQLITCTSQALAETVETHQHSVEVFKQC